MKTIFSLIFFILFCSTAYSADLYIFTATWCPPCQQLKRFIYQNPDVFDGHVVTMIDIDRYPEIKNKYRVSKIPTTIALKDDKELERIIGFNSSYKNWIRNIEK